MPEPPAGKEWFEFYCEWLADYLYRTEIPIHPRQRAWFELTNEKHPGSMIFWISEGYSTHFHEIQSIEASHKDGETWETFQARQLLIWEEWFEGNEEENHYEAWRIEEHIWSRVGDELKEQHDLGEYPTHHDIPFRGMMSEALKDISDRDQRTSQIRRFFLNIQENLEK